MQKKDLVILHGALGAAVQFNELVQMLNDAFHVHALDLKGHGERADSLSFTIPELTDDLIALLYNNNIHEAHIFGYSMGGYIALSAAMQKPDLIKSIFTLATKFNWNQETIERETAMLQPDQMLEKVPAYIETLKKMHGDYWEKLVLNTSAMMKHLSLMPLSELDLATIKIPVRLAIGDKDQMVSIDETIMMYRALKRGSLLVIPDTKHPIEKVSTGRLANEIIDFIKTHG